ncbi:hypothetical protein [Streptomyces silvensis]|uniref:hypothetical protein n=1 Tax=Streptomyces silvensis TaxID=1765722 RepID=UPI000A590418|nr:hypothetical protein [Streptomyces silvensis]
MLDLHGWITQQIDAAEQHALDHQRDPSDALRWCKAHRKILTTHAPAGGGGSDAYACEGCGYNGADYCPELNVEHVNDCPTLLALAEGYGLTKEQRAALDRPEPERPAPTGPSLIPAALAEAMYGHLLATVVGVQPVPSPRQRALEILGPELKKISGYLPSPSSE